MKLKAYTSDNDEEIAEVEALYFDGYLIGERRLEGLPIKVQINHLADEIVISANWPKGVDGAYWATIAKEFVMEHDCFSTTPELDNDDGFILFEEESK